MVIYEKGCDNVVVDDLRGGFFEGWPNPPSPEAHLRILQGSAVVFIARVGAARPVVGFITAITDGVSAAFIPHLEVLPAYRRQGVGAELVRRMLAHFEQLYALDLVCDPDLQPFYARFGLRPVGAMARRNYARQSCE